MPTFWLFVFYLGHSPCTPTQCKSLPHLTSVEDNQAPDQGAMHLLTPSTIE